MKNTILIFLMIGMAGVAYGIVKNDACPTSIMGIHGVIEWDAYGYGADFANTNHILYYDWKRPQTSLVDSTQPGCQKFEDVMGVYEGYDRGFLWPGLQWANNNTCPTISGCGPFDDDGRLTSDDRMVFVVYTSTEGPGYTSKVLVDSVAFDTWFSRFPFDNSFGDGQGGEGVTHQLHTLTAPAVELIGLTTQSVTVRVRIQEPEYDPTGERGGLYGDDAWIASHLIAGYKVVAMVSSTRPGSAMVNSNNWNLPIDSITRYIPASSSPAGGIVTSEPIDLPVSSIKNLYIAYVPIFNYVNGCRGTQCTPEELKMLDSLGGQLNNSLAGRIASSATKVKRGVVGKNR